MAKRFFKLMSVFLVLILLVNMLPLGAFAQQLQSANADIAISANAAEDVQPEDAQILAEIPEKRTAYSKEFLLSNGLRMAAVYPEPVHFRTAKGWTDIDNTLVTRADGTLTNTNAPWSVSFPQALTDENRVTVTVDGYSLSFVLAGQVRSAGSAARSSAPSLEAARRSQAAVKQPGALLQEMQLDEDKSVPQKLYSRLTYADVFENTDVVYDLESNAVKESIVLEKYDSSLQGYRYTLYTGKLIPQMDDTGHIDLYAPNGKEPVMSLPAPYLIDDAGAYCDEVQVTLTGSDGVYTMTYTLPQQWLAAEDRAWPVIMDPIVKANTSASNIQDRTISEKKHISYKKSVFYAGYDPDMGKIRGYLQYNDLPILNSSDVVVNATFKMYKVMSSSSSGVVEVHKVTEGWTSQEIEWADQPDFTESISDYKNVKSQGWYSWNITDIVRDWYMDENHGLMIKMPDSVEAGSTKRFRQFYSSDAGSAYRPKLEITIRNNNGLESYWDYTSASAGRAGTGHVNNFTGNLTWVREDMGFGGSVMPVSISHVYNLNDSTPVDTGNNSNMTAGNYFHMGNGWRINYSERVFDWKVTGITSDDGYYIWEDSDGTDHYFKKKKTSTYNDEDGLELTLTNNGEGDGKYKIKDKQGNTRYFDTLGRLRKIENNQKTKSYITITYVDDTQEIDVIRDSAGREYRFSYANELLTKIGYYGANAPENADPIREITYAYDAEKNLILISETLGENDPNSYSCSFEYTEEALSYTESTIVPDSQTPSTDPSDSGPEGSEDENGTVDDGTADDADPEETTPAENADDTDSTEPAETDTPAETTQTTDSEDTADNRNLHVLSAVTDPTGYKLSYTYYQPTALWRPYRVASVAEKDGNADGGCIRIDYGHNETVFTDHKNQVEIHQYDDFGHTVSIRDDKGRAQFNQFTFSTDAEKESNTDAAVRNHQLTLSSELQYSVANLMVDNSMSSISQWTAFGSFVQCTKSTSYRSTDKDSVKVKLEGADSSEGELFGITYKTPFVIQPGQTHTFSCDLRSDATVYLQAKSTENTVKSDPVNIYTGWYRQQVSYTNDTDQPVSVTYSVVAEDYGEFYMDCPQLELSNNASRYNLADNGDFSTLYGWEAKNFGDADGSVILQDPVVPHFNNSVVKINGETGKKKSVSQDIYMDGKTGDSLIFAGWAKGNSAPLGTFGGKTRKFAIECRLVYNDDTKSKVYSAVFNPDSYEWQYTAGGIVAAKDFYRVELSVVYDHNVNSAMFDGIQLYKEPFGTTFQYASGTDEKRIVTVTDCNNQKTVSTYNKYDNLIKKKLPTGVEISYSYDSHHNLTQVSESNGLKTTYTYDTYGNNTKVTATDGTSAMVTATEYTADGNLVRKTTDAEGLETVYEYDPQTGLLLWGQQTADGETLRTTYSYDSLYRQTGQRLGTVTAGEDGAQQVTAITSADYTYEDDLLTGITTPTTAYGFQYSDFSQRVKATVGNRTLAEYTYSNDKDRLLLGLDYGNGDKVEYTYDAQGRVIMETYEDGDTVTYTYDNAGGVATVTDSSSGIQSEVIYSADDQLSRYTETGGSHDLLVRYKYDTLERVSSILYMVDNVMGKAHNSTYTYNQKNQLTSFRKGNGVLDYSYDKFERTTKTELTHKEADILTTEYTFLSPASGQTGSRVGTLEKTAADYSVTYTYTYDDRGNILSVSDGTHTTTYVYDSQNQLLRENNQAGNFTHTWEYDNAGNIQCRKEYTYTTAENLNSVTPTDTVEYTYGDTGWGDLLTAYDGTAITYDEIGNPNAIGGWSFTWEHGRELASMSNGTATWTNTYNADGLRTKRTDSTLTYDYVYYSGQLMYMMVKDTEPQSPTKGSHHLILSYTPEGSPMGMTYQGTAYYYLTNLQGDVVAILNNQGQRIVSYSYDAWGNPTTPVIHVAADDANYQKYCTIAQLNPLRYRGYVYDTETGLYYLQSRYYDPEIGRFVNVDSQLNQKDSILGYNMFAYCQNNPIMYSDPTGHSITVVCIIVGAVIGAVAGGFAGAYISKKQTGEVNGSAVAAGAVIGGVVGGLVGWGVGAAIPTVGATAAGTASGTIAQASNTLYDNWQSAEVGLRQTMNSVTDYSSRVFNTPKGIRVVDAYNAASGIIAESKYGYQVNSSFIRSEIARDAYLLRSGAVNEVQWHFYYSQTSQSIGGSYNLIRGLLDSGINVIFH